MTLFSLNSDRKNIRRNFFIYLGVVAFCVVFGIVYESFSHGIISIFTLYGFVIPLVLGLFPYFILFISKSTKGPGEITSYLYNSGVATLTVGSYFKGMLEIYGTTRDLYETIYFVVAGVLIGLGIVAYLISLSRGSAKAPKEQ